MRGVLHLQVDIGRRRPSDDGKCLILGAGGQGGVRSPLGRPLAEGPVLLYIHISLYKVETYLCNLCKLLHSSGERHSARGNISALRHCLSSENSPCAARARPRQCKN